MHFVENLSSSRFDMKYYNDYQAQRYLGWVNLKDYDLIFVPVLIDNNHFTLATIKMHSRTIEYYNSKTGEQKDFVLEVLRRFLNENVHDDRFRARFANTGERL